MKKNFFSIPHILNESSLVNQEVRVKNNNKTLAEGRALGAHPSCLCSLVSVAQRQFPHFADTLLPGLPGKPPQESHLHILRPLAKIKGKRLQLPRKGRREKYLRSRRDREPRFTLQTAMEKPVSSREEMGGRPCGHRQPCTGCALGARGGRRRWGRK